MNFQNSPENFIILVTGILHPRQLTDGTWKRPQRERLKNIFQTTNFFCSKSYFFGVYVLNQGSFAERLRWTMALFCVPNDTGTWRVSPLHFSRRMHVQKNIMYIYIHTRLTSQVWLYLLKTYISCMYMIYNNHKYMVMYSTRINISIYISIHLVHQYDGNHGNLCWCTDHH